MASVLYFRKDAEIPRKDCYFLMTSITLYLLCSFYGTRQTRWKRTEYKVTQLQQRVKEREAV